MLPRPRYSRLSSHKYKRLGLDLLKMSAIYGANGSGKSSLIKGMRYLKSIITNPESTFRSGMSPFKFFDEGKPQTFGVEFIQDERAYYYAVEITDGIITSEELNFSGLGEKPDIPLFVRKSPVDGKTSLTLMDEFEKESKVNEFKSILLDEFLKPGNSIFKLLANRKIKYFIPVREAYSWFSKTLQIIDPETRPLGIALKLDDDSDFKDFADEMMKSFDVGVNSICIEKYPVQEFFGIEKKNFIRKIEKKFHQKRMKNKGKRRDYILFNINQNDVIVVEHENELFVKQIKFEHQGYNGRVEKFSFSEESDGTVRLLEFIPAFADLVNRSSVYLIDEIERSLHPLMVKGLVDKFSKDDTTKGQLIFSTHESNLLDQEILRQDEIWFTEKDPEGMTDLYSLSDFKEHNTTDIRRGYLHGRFGSIPFISNLEDLNWRTELE